MSRTDTSSPSTREPLLTRPFVLLGLAELAYFTATGVTVYTLPVYVTGPVGSDAAGAGLAFGAFAVVALVCRPVVGRLVDRYGRRPTLLAGALLCALGTALTAHATTLEVAVALRLLLGGAEAAFFVAAVAAVMDLAPRGRTGEAMSYNSLGLYLGLTAGPPLGELLTRTTGFDAAWSAAAALAVLAALLVTRVGETRPPAPAKGAKGQLIHRPTIPVGLVFLASTIAMGGFLAFGALYAERVGLGTASLPILTYGAVVVLVRIVLADASDRFPALPLAAGAVLTTAAGLTVLATWPSAAGAVAGAAVVGVGVALSTPLSSPRSTRGWARVSEVPPPARPAPSSTWGSASGRCSSARWRRRRASPPRSPPRRGWLSSAPSGPSCWRAAEPAARATEHTAQRPGHSEGLRPGRQAAVVAPEVVPGSSPVRRCGRPGRRCGRRSRRRC